MPGEHYVILVPGMGEGNAREALTGFWNGLRDAYGRGDAARLAAFDRRFRPIYAEWYDSTAAAETRLHEACFGPVDPAVPFIPGPWLLGHLGDFVPKLYQSLRKFLVFYVGDVIAYTSEDVNFMRTTVYDRAFSNAWIDPQGTAKIDLIAALTGDLDATYSIVAHSLGSIIAFDYLIQMFLMDQLFLPPAPGRAKEPIPHDDVRKARLRYFFTMGSPLAVFLLRYGDLWDSRVAIPFSGVQNPFRDDRDAPHNDKRFWVNYHDRDDVLALPLRNLLQADAANLKYFNEQPAAIGWTPDSAHLDWYRSADILRDVAARLERL